MNRYLVQEELGDGTFGTVFHAIRRADNTEVAIKRLKRTFPTWDEIPMLREFRALQELTAFQHTNIVQLEEVIREANQNLFFVFEYMPDGNLYEFIKHHTPPPKSLAPSTSTSIPPVLSEAKIRSISMQILEGLAFLHSRGYIHRDIKPENILMKGDVCKLADFGLARESSCQSAVTDYVSTRWYRAPEVLLRSPVYGKPIDLFGVGCVMAELYSKAPLFPGENEIEQVYLITQVLGSPDLCWQEGIRLADKLGMRLKCERPKSLRDRVPSASSDAVDFMTRLLQWNPDDRPTCEAALVHQYFAEVTNLGIQSTPILARKRPITVSVSPNHDGRLTKMPRLEGSPSPRSIQRIFDHAWNFPNLPHCNRNMY
ncbi:protein kinase [Fragilaria crotonensis]|nr:protein kinase [Fragilaria crotonensis]